MHLLTLDRARKMWLLQRPASTALFLSSSSSNPHDWVDSAALPFRHSGTRTASCGPSSASPVGHGFAPGAHLDVVIGGRARPPVIGVAADFAHLQFTTSACNLQLVGNYADRSITERQMTLVGQCLHGWKGGRALDLDSHQSATPPSQQSEVRAP